MAFFFYVPHFIWLFSIFNARASIRHTFGPDCQVSLGSVAVRWSSTALVPCGNHSLCATFDRRSGSGHSADRELSHDSRLAGPVSCNVVYILLLIYYYLSRLCSTEFVPDHNENNENLHPPMNKSYVPSDLDEIMEDVQSCPDDARIAVRQSSPQESHVVLDHIRCSV